MSDAEDRLETAMHEALSALTESIEESGADLALAHAREFLPDLVWTFCNGGSDNLQNPDLVLYGDLVSRLFEAMNHALAEVEDEDLVERIKVIQERVDYYKTLDSPIKRDFRILDLQDAPDAASRINNDAKDFRNCRKAAIAHTKAKS
jgi:hypothetical protein